MKLSGSVTSRSVRVQRISTAELFAYVGLDHGMGIICYNNIDQHSSTDVLDGYPMYKNTMGENKFELICNMICQQLQHHLDQVHCMSALHLQKFTSQLKILK
jgi:hypothetical protein